MRQTVVALALAAISSSAAAGDWRTVSYSRDALVAINEDVDAAPKAPTRTVWLATAAVDGRGGPPMVISLASFDCAGRWRIERSQGYDLDARPVTEPSSASGWWSIEAGTPAAETEAVLCRGMAPVREIKSRSVYDLADAVLR